jgi:hypothetical protein
VFYGNVFRSSGLSQSEHPSDISFLCTARVASENTILEQNGPAECTKLQDSDERQHHNVIGLMTIEEITDIVSIAKLGV